MVAERKRKRERKTETETFAFQAEKKRERKRERKRKRKTETETETETKTKTKTKTKTETFAFQAEISKLVSIVINTFYSDLITNFSDAVNKIQLKSLTHVSQPELKIYILPDKSTDTLAIAVDSRLIGMTKKDLLDNLGTTAAPAAGTEVGMFGQFGVGFYSAFFVAADRVVANHNDDDERYLWEAQAGGSFTVTRGTLGGGRGRRSNMTLFLKEDQLEYPEEQCLKDLVPRDSEFISFKDYITGMMEGQNVIYYITGESKKALENSTFLKRLKKKGYVVQLKEFDGRKVVFVTSKEMLKPDENEDKKKKKKAVKKSEGLCKAIKKMLGEKVVDVVVSDRVDDSPCWLVMGANTGRILPIIKAWTSRDWLRMLPYQFSKKTMEINPENPIMVELWKRVRKNDKFVKDLVLLLFDASLIAYGFRLDEPHTSGPRFHNLLKLLPVFQSADADTDMPPLKENALEENAEVLLDYWWAEFEQAKGIDDKRFVWELATLIDDMFVLASGNRHVTLDKPCTFGDMIHRTLIVALNIGEVEYPEIIPYRYYSDEDSSDQDG